MPLRYSPEKIKTYNRGDSGPGHSAFLRDDPEAWNLAWLSHPFEREPNHPNHSFTVLVHHTVNATLATGAHDATGRFKPTELVRSLLQLRADEFIQALEACMTSGATPVHLLDRLPMYQAFGDAWVQTMRQRAPTCLRAPVADDDSLALPFDKVTSLDAALAVIERVRRLP